MTLQPIDTDEFIAANGFSLSEHIDPQVRRYFGAFLTEAAKSLLSTQFDMVHYTPLVWINCNDNSDFDCPDTVRVEIGLKAQDKDRDEYKNGDLVFVHGRFGRSSAFCANVEDAMKEAAMAFLYSFCRPEFNIVAFHRRDN